MSDLNRAASEINRAHELLADRPTGPGTGLRTGPEGVQPSDRILAAASAHALVGIGLALLDTNRLLEEIATLSLPPGERAAARRMPRYRRGS